MPNNPKNTRKCCVCREHADKSELIRVAKTESGYIVDADCKLSGRGAYVHRNAECVALAIKRRALNAAFKTAVPESVYETLKNEL